MEVRPKRVVFYDDAKGKLPFKDWLESLQDVRIIAKVKARIERLRLGAFGVHELKIDYGAGFRLYFGQPNAELVVLLLGGMKRTQAKDIWRARLCWAEYRRRKNG